MKTRALIPGLILSLTLGSAPAWAAVTSCEAIKDKISTKLAGKNVSNYALEVVAQDTQTKLRVVGSCEGGSKKLIYKKTRHAKPAEE